MSHYNHSILFSLLFFFNDTATTEIYTLSLHDALPISADLEGINITRGSELLTLYQFNTNTAKHYFCSRCGIYTHQDRKSTRLNSSHMSISYAVFCLKKKKKKK